MNIYLDNAATTPVSNEVFAEMKPYVFQSFAKPSSAHALGRDARAAVERSRKLIAENLNAGPENTVKIDRGKQTCVLHKLMLINHK
jgi:cysteine desulfurase